MISAEGEEVPLKKRINPNATNVSIDFAKYQMMLKHTFLL